MSTNWLRTRLSQLLRQRHEVHKPTWITTNCRTLAELAAAVEPPPDPGERSPMERLVTVAEQHFLRVELPAYDQVRAQLDSSELPFAAYNQAGADRRGIPAAGRINAGDQAVVGGVAAVGRRG